MYVEMHYFICDKCQTLSTKSLSYYDALLSAKRNGWLLEIEDLNGAENLKDLCPKCAEESAPSPA